MQAEQNQHPQHAAAYRFEKLSTALFLRDVGFTREDAQVGTTVDDVALERLDGTPVRLAEVISGRPLLLIFGSVSCPMTFASTDPLRRLHGEFGGEVRFATLNVREAHPGERMEQPQTAAAKRSHARLLAAATDSPWETFVDSLDGTLHRRLAEKPNAAYLLAADRTILFRSLWAGDETGLRAALLAAREGRALPRPQSTSALGPLLAGLGFFGSTLARSGSRAKRELLVAAAPVALLAAAASLFPSVAPHRRGGYAVGLVVSLLFLTTSCAVWLSR